MQKPVSEVLTAISDGTLPEGVFFFDLRDEAGKDKKPGGHGHVGFLLVSGTGKEQKVTQIHMSNAKSATGLNRDGLAYNDKFAEFLKGTRYGTSDAAQKSSQLTLYKLP